MPFEFIVNIWIFTFKYRKALHTDFEMNISLCALCVEILPVSYGLNTHLLLQG